MGLAMNRLISLHYQQFGIAHGERWSHTKTLRTTLIHVCACNKMPEGKQKITQFSTLTIKLACSYTCVKDNIIFYMYMYVYAVM